VQRTWRCQGILFAVMIVHAIRNFGRTGPPKETYFLPNNLLSKEKGLRGHRNTISAPRTAT